MMKTLYPVVKTRRYIAAVQKQFTSILPLFFSFCFYSILLAPSVANSQKGISRLTFHNYPAVSGYAYTGWGGGMGSQTEYQAVSNNIFTYHFGLASGLNAGSSKVNGYIADGSAFSVIQNLNVSVKMRRVNNSMAAGNRDILFFTGNRNPDIDIPPFYNSFALVNLNAEYIPDMQTAFSSNNLFIGTDNIFANQGNGNGNNNNIERVDVIIAGGFVVSNAHKQGFPILERGTYGAHDKFKIAAITAIDGSGNPSAFSNIVSATAADYNNTGNINPVEDAIYTYFLFRRNGANKLEINQHIADQGVGGVAFRFSDFGIADGTVIYGYSILADDFNGISGSDAVNFNNAAHFPTTTTESIGGLDPLAVIGIAEETIMLPVELSSFNAVEKEGIVRLSWETKSEINNVGFTVEHSADGSNWSKIGFVASKASETNSNSELLYSYDDNTPFSGRNYYRLRQRDEDNHEKTSDTRLVNIDNDLKVIKLFPNPAENSIYIQGIKPGNNLRLMDTKGATATNFIATTTAMAMPIDKLSAGVYFLQVMDKGSVIKTIKFIKRS